MRLLTKKIFAVIINMTYSCRVRFVMIHTEREREEPSCRRHDIHCSDRHAAERSEGALPGNEDGQDDPDIKGYADDPCWASEFG